MLTLLRLIQPLGYTCIYCLLPMERQGQWYKCPNPNCSYEVMA